MIKFFIVDDEPMLHELYCDILEMKGHEIVGRAFNGNECLDKILQSNPHPKLEPDIIIMDHRMPLKNGLDTMRELLENQPGLKIIFVSADVSIKDKAVANGASGFIKKPFNIQAFFRSIEDIGHD